jgi:hypothetical protein
LAEFAVAVVLDDTQAAVGFVFNVDVTVLLDNSCLTIKFDARCR